MNHAHAVLGTFSEKAQEYAARVLKRDGVQIKLVLPFKRSAQATCTLRRHKDKDPRGNLGRWHKGGAVGR